MYKYRVQERGDGMPILGKGLTRAFLVFVCACSPGKKIDQGSTLIGEAMPASADAQIPSETVTSIDAESTQGIATSTSAAQALPQQNNTDDPMNDDESNSSASEPIAIGGSYLVCNYQNNQSQGSESYRLDCQIEPATDVTTKIASARFYKIDAQGNRTALAIVSQNLETLSWTIQENMNTLQQFNIQAVLTAADFLDVTFDTVVTPTFSLTPNPNYFLGGEPNNVTSDEDCVEFVMARYKRTHQNFTGLASGPLGRMNDNVCTLSYNFLCRNVSAGASAAKWLLSAARGPFANGSLACSAGYSFGFPLNAVEVGEVSTIVDRFDVRIWVNMNDRITENTFIIKYR